MTDALRQIAAAVLWLAVALVLALGASGIVAAANRPPVGGIRPELTWATDRALEPELTAAAGDLAALSDEVDALGGIGRKALVALVDQRIAAVRKAVTDGEAQVTEIEAATEALRRRLAAVPGIGPDDVTRIGSALRSRYDRLVAALSATDGLSVSWSALTRGSLAAIGLTTSLADHDTFAVQAAALGLKGSYKKALAALDKADAALATSAGFRDQLAKTVDVGVLTEWIDRNAAFDTAVRKVWTLLAKSKGKVTAAIRVAFDELRTAQANLPPDGRALVVIMSDVARGGMNQAVIEIEQARARLAAAVDALAEPTAEPTPTPIP